jgi:hypothetical protein
MPSHVQRRSAAFLLVFLLAGASASLAPAQDLTTNTGVFSRRPRNPPAHPRRRVSRTGVARKGKELSAQPPAPGSAPKEKGDQSPREEEAWPEGLNDAVEDALALGNSARDADPPRYRDAERAYRLALKLAPKDPRAHVGLANIYYDQQQFQQAAEHYRRALTLERLLDDGPPPEGRAGKIKAQPPKEKRAKGKFSPPPPTFSARDLEWQTYLAAALLQQGRFLEALMEISYQVEDRTKNDTVYAIVASALFGLRRYSEAATYIEHAARLAPGRAEYAELLQRARAKQVEITPLSEATRRELEGTKWLTNRRADRVCEFLRGGRVQCRPQNQLSHDWTWETEGDVIHLRSTLPTWRCVGLLARNRVAFHCGYQGRPSILMLMDWTKAEN